MLQSIRQSVSGWLATVILMLLCIPFVFVGVHGLVDASSDDFAAKVNDTEIATGQFEEQYGRHREQMRQMLGTNFDPEQFEQPAARREFLERLIDAELMRQEAANAGMAPTDDEVRRAIRDMSVFQVEGRFSESVYVDLLRQNGLTPDGFFESMRRDLAASRLPQGLASSVFITDLEVDQVLRVRNEQRSYDALPLAADVLLGDAEISVDEAALEAYYQANLGSFQTAEQVSVDYILVSAKDFMDEVGDPTDEELQDFYEREAARFVVPAQRLASHILFEVAPGADPEQLKAVQAAAEAAREQLLAGADFAELASSLSQDPGSAAQGGDLGWIERGGGMDEAFEDALFALEAEQPLSMPVLSSFGFHLIQFREERAEQRRPFEELTEQLRTELKETEAERLYTDRASRMVDLANEVASELEPAADAAGVEIQRAGPFTRFGGTGIATNPAVTRAAFSDLVLKDLYNSDPIDLGEQGIVILRLAEHLPAVTQPLDEVREQVEQGALQAERTRLLQERADQMLARLRSGEITLEALAADLGIELQVQEGVTRTATVGDIMLMREVFELPRLSGDARTEVVRYGGQVALVRLRAVEDGDPATVDVEERQRVRQGLSFGLQRAESGGVLQNARERAQIRLPEDGI